VIRGLFALVCSLRTSSKPECPGFFNVVLPCGVNVEIRVNSEKFFIDLPIDPED
jgi:hypothetical protein